MPTTRKSNRPGRGGAERASRNERHSKILRWQLPNKSGCTRIGAETVECAPIPPFLHKVGNSLRSDVRQRKACIAHKVEDVSVELEFPSCLGRQSINPVRAATMFADQVEGIAAFAREHPLYALGYLALCNIFLYIFFTEIERYNARLAGFKGPTGFPMIGNIWQIRTNAAEQYRRWAKRFGAVYQIQLGNVPVVVVNSAAAARTIFGQNAQALSSRPEFYTFHKVCASCL